MEELKPCPFCGGQASLYGCRRGSDVECKECGARTKYFLDGIFTNENSMRMAVEAWNRRDP